MASRFGHHHIPGTDFIMEVNALTGLMLSSGTDKTELRERIARAMEFNTGGYPEAITAKDTLRRLQIEAAELGPVTERLVADFSRALRAKLVAAEAKYGHRDDWATDDWESDCREQLRAHLDKGDPLDVAAYCAFMWSRGWSTATPATVGA